MSAAVTYDLEAQLEAQPAGQAPVSPLPEAANALQLWLRSQKINAARHSAAIRPFLSREFDTGPESPSEAHLQAANRLIQFLRQALLKTSQQLGAMEKRALAQPAPQNLRAFEELKEQAQRWVQATEKVWNFYFELFNQRQTRIARYLLAADRIALDCYQAVYVNLGKARSVPSPPPFAYMESGFGPATFRRGVFLTKLGKRANPFPLVKLPYHRLVNPWTLGAIPHEVAHNIQADLGLWNVLPKVIFRRLRQAEVDRSTAMIWARWHKEIYADLCGLLLCGPAFVTSLMDIVGHSPARTMGFNPRGVHPTPYLRVFINLQLLRRMGFEREAEEYRGTWNRLYPRRLASAIPEPILKTFPLAHELVVETICETPYAQCDGKSLLKVVHFSPKEQVMVQEAAGRLASGTDPGILPARFLIGASRIALDRQLARPGVITRNFYDALGRR